MKVNIDKYVLAVVVISVVVPDPFPGTDIPVRPFRGEQSFPRNADGRCCQ